MRSPVRASILPDPGGRATASGDPVVVSNGHLYREKSLATRVPTLFT
jgi:hypothetical protein